MYGLKHSANAFHDHLTSTFVYAGFAPTDSYPCLLIRKHGDNLMWAFIHMDDILCISKLRGMYEVIVTALKNRYEQITVTLKPISYLGMNITRNMNDSTIYLEMALKTKEIIEKYGDSEYQQHDKKSADYIDKRLFMSKVMTILYLTRFTRYDILKEVT